MALAPVPSGYTTSDYTARRNYNTGRSPVVGVQNGIAVAVEKSPSWDKLAKRFKDFKGSDALVKTGLIKWAMAEGVKVAQSQLDILVYKAPLPPSAANDPNYLQHARTGRTREAVKQRPDQLAGVKGDSGAIVVDKANYKATYYAGYLDRYNSYWHLTALIMAPRFSAKARDALKEIKQDLKVT